MEFAIQAAQEIKGLKNVILASIGTDGTDGPTDAAGAVVTGKTLKRATEINQHPLEFLNRNDAYKFFEPLGDLLKPGSTQTNVNDLTFLLIF